MKHGGWLAPWWMRLEFGADGCIRYTGALSKGYGTVCIDGKNRPVHRVVYELLRGPIPEGWDLHHTCEVRECCNPSHLRPLSRKDHARTKSGHIAANVLKTHCPRGHLLDYVCPKGKRGCLTCRRAQSKASHKRRKAK